MCAAKKLLIFLFAVLTLLLVLMLALGCSPRGAVCVVTGRPAEHSKLLRLGGRCYRLQTCSPGCHRHLEACAAADAEAFGLRYDLRQNDPTSLTLHHPESRAPQVIFEVACDEQQHGPIL